MSGRPQPLVGPDDLRRLSNLDLIARWIVDGTLLGLHRSPLHGFSMEFAEYREYSRGDDLRYFDWKVFGRSDRNYIKKFHSETNLPCHLVVDASASMGYGDPSKLQYAKCLAAAIANVLQRQMDAVGLLLLDEEVRLRVPPAIGPAHVRRITKVLEDARPASKTKLAPALDDLAEAAGRRGIVVVLSDLYDDEEAVLRAVQHLRFKGHEVIVLHLMDPAELHFEFEGLTEFEDMETRGRMEVDGPTIRDEYHRLLAEWLRAIRDGCEAVRADYRMVETSEPFAVVLADYLQKRRLGRAAP